MKILGETERLLFFRSEESPHANGRQNMMNKPP
jgi:hypothetical protein